MALIYCEECGNQISDRAEICPHCGLPIREEADVDLNASISTNEIISCPESFPNDLSIGQQIVNWQSDAAFNGIYNIEENTINSIPSGKVKVTLHTHGVRIYAGIKTFEIHNSQLISIVETTSSQIMKVKKSVIGRAVVGNLVMGPIGAIVGAISGIGTKDKTKVTQYVVINFWDVNTRTPQSILIQCDGSQPIDAFIARQKKEDITNVTEEREPEEEHLPVWIKLCIIAIVLIFILLLLQ